MNLEGFLNLSREDEIIFDEGRDLHRDICLKGIAAVPDDQRERLRDYLDLVLLHGAAEPHLRGQLDAIHAAFSAAR